MIYDFPPFRRWFVASLIRPVFILMMALGASVLTTHAGHHQCSCSFNSENFSCTVSQTCHIDNCAECNCNSQGCTASCKVCGGGGGGGVEILPKGARFDLMLERTTLAGVQHHLENPAFGWKVILEVDSGARITRMFEDVTLEELVAALADEFDVCGEVHAPLGVITFKPRRACR